MKRLNIILIIVFNVLSTNAQIISTDISPDFSIALEDTTPNIPNIYSIDMNNDEIEDFNNLPEFNDSIMDISFNNNKTKFRSFIPARITLSYWKYLNHRYFKTLLIQSHSRWQPYEVKGGINWDLFNRGLSESGYNTNLDVRTNIDLTYLYSTVGFSVGGFTDQTVVALTSDLPVVVFGVMLIFKV